MPPATRRSTQRAPSDESGSGATRHQLPSRGGPARSRTTAPSSTDSHVDSDEIPPADLPAFQSNMAAQIPQNIVAALDSMRRNMDLNFRALQEIMQAQRNDFDKERISTDKRFDNVDKRFDRMEELSDKRFEHAQQERMALHANRGATHIHSRIRPVGRWNKEAERALYPDGLPTHVHQFLRLKNRNNWNALLALLRFYDIQSWPTWGIYSMWSDDESDTEELLAPKHGTLEEAIEYAPEIALQEVAAVIGLDYDRIIANREEDKRLQENREILRKRALAVVPVSAKREKLDRAPTQEQAASRVTQQPPVTASPKPESEEIGWDTRKTEDRTPPESKPRVRDTHPYKQRRSPSH